jgi:hypothetical protein
MLRQRPITQATTGNDPDETGHRFGIALRLVGPAS